jgi:hypothetical protein
MHNVHVDFGHPLLGAYKLFSLTAVLQSHRECRESEQPCLLALCSLSGMIVSSQTHDTFVYCRGAQPFWQTGCIERYNVL